MVYRLLLDENVEHEVFHRLENYRHDIEHVDFVPELGRGTGDHAIAAYSLTADQVLLTYDDDFVLTIEETEYFAVLYVGDGTLAPREVADIVQELSQHYPMAELAGVKHVSSVWL